MAGDVLERLRYADPRLKKRIVLGVVAVVLFVAAGVLFARMVLPTPPDQPEVPGLTRSGRADRDTAQAAREEREREAERLRQDMREKGVDPEANPRAAEMRDGG